MNTTPFLLLATLLTTPLLAQGETVLPVSLDKFWGQGSSSVLGQDSSRTQLISAMPVAPGTTITGLGLRPTASTSDRASFTADIEIRLSSGPNAPGSLDATFANNIGNDEVVVLPQQTITVPAMPANRSTGFYVDIPFTTPFVFGTNGNTNLVVEVLVFSRSAGASWSTDRVFAGASGRAGTAGIGCGSATIGSSSTNASGSTYVAGETVDVTISGGTPNSAALLVPSLDMKELVPGLLLPFDLSMVGAGPGCDLLVAGEIGAVTYLTDALGDAAMSLPLTSAFTGQSIGFQWVYLVPPSSTNPLGLATTPSRVVTIGPRIAVPEVQYVWNLFDVNATSGTATTDSCPVHKLFTL
ncbi:MAG: hypothetical protein ACE37K_06105 [Planctomycetota bacterium]